MKHKISTVAAAMLLASSLPVSAEMCSSFNPYVGADAQYRYMPFEKDFGGNIFKKTSPQANFFVGNRFNEYFGLELGYSTSKKVKRDVTLPEGSILAGTDPTPIGAGTDAVHSTSKISGFSVTALGFLPVPTIDCLEVVGSLGLTRLKAKLFYNELGNTVNPITDGIRTFSARKTVMRLGGGVQYALTEHLSIRGLVNWENTRRFQNVKSRESALPVLKLKNSIIYSLGLQFSF